MGDDDEQGTRSGGRSPGKVFFAADTDVEAIVGTIFEASRAQTDFDEWLRKETEAARGIVCPRCGAAPPIPAI